MRMLLSIFLFVTISANGQKLLIIGNFSPLCLSVEGDLISSLEDSLVLKNYDGIFIFSTASSPFSNEDVQRITTYISNGGGVYIGADNWPLTSEFDQISEHMYNKRSFGNYEISNASGGNTHGNLGLNDMDTIPAGKSTRAFPLDHRLKVEAWVDDDPLIQSGQFGDGRIVIDGGYSRFYCEHSNKKSQLIFERIMDFLISINE